MPKTPIGIDVLEAAQSRIAIAFDRCTKAYVAFSGGKDSTVLLHLVMDEAIRRGRKVAVVFIDMEGQYELTIDHIAECYSLYADHIEPYWIALPLHLRNAVSTYEPFWLCWDEEARNAWIRQPPEMAIVDPKKFPFFEPGMEFEELVPLFGEWYAGDEDCACFVGIRSDESLNRWRTIASTRKAHLDQHLWTTWVTPKTLNIYPIYDWRTEDIWTYQGLNSDLPYNKVYDLMHKAGLSIHQMRLCQPYGDDQRRGLYLFHIIEPETWCRIVARVNGANAGSLYANTSGNMTGYRRVSKPDHHTWHSFAESLLESMPDKTREHFRIKIDLHRRWWMERGYPEGIPDSVPYVLESQRKAPSWRRIVKALLRNDYWCKGLGFTQHKSAAYARYIERMSERRKEWGMDRCQLDLGATE